MIIIFYGIILSFNIINILDLWRYDWFFELRGDLVFLRANGQVGSALAKCVQQNVSKWAQVGDIQVLSRAIRRRYDLPNIGIN